MKLCGSPGCTKPDFHIGPCSTECATKRNPVLCYYKEARTNNFAPRQIFPKPKRCLKPPNEFQLGLEVCRELMDYQVGVKFWMSLSEINGYHDGPETFPVTISKVIKDETRMVVGVWCPHDNSTIDLTPASLMLKREPPITFNPVPASIMEKIRTSRMAVYPKRHADSMKRAIYIARYYIDRALYSSNFSNNDIILTLDGNGENRDAMMQKFARFNEKSDKHPILPRIITVERDATVALCQHLIWGTASDKIIFTNAGAGKSVKGFEHLILHPNNLITDKMKKNIKIIYFDYCGGPAEDIRKLFEHLPNICLFGITVAKRKRPNLINDFELFVAIPDGWKEVKCYNHKEVVCVIYERN